MKKIILVALTLALLVCCVITVASAASTTDFDPYLRFTNIGTIEVVETLNGDSAEMKETDCLGFFSNYKVLSLKNYNMTKKMEVTLDSNLPICVDKFQIGSEPAAYTFYSTEPMVVKLDSITLNGDKYEIKFLSVKKELVKVGVRPDSQNAGSYSSFDAVICGSSDAVIFDPDTCSAMTGYYYIGDQEIPIVLGSSGTAEATNFNSYIQVSANANGLNLLNMLTESDNKIYFWLDPTIPIKLGSVNIYPVSSLSAKFTVLPASGNTTVVPSTGDSTPVALYVSLALCCLAVIAVLVIRRRHA